MSIVAQLSVRLARSYFIVARESDIVAFLSKRPQLNRSEKQVANVDIDKAARLIDIGGVFTAEIASKVAQRQRLYFHRRAFATM